MARVSFVSSTVSWNTVVVASGPAKLWDGAVELLEEMLLQVLTLSHKQRLLV